ncbi:protein of unknown function [Pseudomonas mediterranea]|jgi:hypothetical protein
MTTPIIERLQAGEIYNTWGKASYFQLIKTLESNELK